MENEDEEQVITVWCRGVTVSALCNRMATLVTTCTNTSVLIM